MPRRDPHVAVCDYGAGNLNSILAALKRTGASVNLCEYPEEMPDFTSHIVIPGVASFGTVSNALQESGWANYLATAQSNGPAILGICVGLQFLAKGSDEHGFRQGLGIIDTRVVSIGTPQARQHVGWDEVQFREDTFGFSSQEHPYFYFDHGYALDARGDWCRGTSSYGSEFCAIAKVGRVWGVQFHPELSGELGHKFLAGFIQE